MGGYGGADGEGVDVDADGVFDVWLVGGSSAGFAMPAVGAAAAFTNASANFFDELPDDFEVLEPSQISNIKASDGTQIAQFYAENRIVVPLSEIAPTVQNAIVLILLISILS